MIARALRMVLWTALAVGFGAAIEWSVRQALADYWFARETVPATEKAIAIEPGQSAYHVRLALQAGDTDPVLACAALRRAVELNPADGRAWIELGLLLEAGGDPDGAERALLRAAGEDRTFLPRWTLMNYYYRRGDRDRFWHWAREAAPMIYGDPRPVFDLCGRIEEDGALIDRLEIGDPQIQAAYLFYLLDHGHAALSGPASRRLLDRRRAADTPVLLEACDRLIDAGRAEDALAIWNGLHRSAKDFAAAPSGHGFDWRLPALVGVSAAREEVPSGLRLSFSGTEDETAEPLVRFVPVDARTAYCLKYASETTDIAAGSGLVWRIADTGSNVATIEEDLAVDGSERRIPFVTSPGCRMVRLSLLYRRRAGTLRIRGSLVLRAVEIGKLKGTEGY